MLPTQSLLYKMADTPIPDTKFLGQQANDLCLNVPVYWLSPECITEQINTNLTNSNTLTQCSNCIKKFVVLFKEVRDLMVEGTLKSVETTAEVETLSFLHRSLLLRLVVKW